MAWIVRDRNGNGRIDDFSELYSSSTPQFVVGPDGKYNGFTALATEDTNGDGAITRDDLTYSELFLWFDMNHDGRTDRGELRSSAAEGITQISLAYTPLRETDSGGNIIIYESQGVRQTGQRISTIRLYDVLIRTALLPNGSQ